MSIFKYLLSTVLIFSLLTGCGGSGAGSAPVPEPEASPAMPVTPPAAPSEPPADAPASESHEGPTVTYIEQLAQETVAKFLRPGMGEYEKAKAAFDYIIETANLTDPLGLELWRVRGDNGQQQPSFVENRAMSVFQFGIGMCEDYASALVLLLRAMGMEAEYVPGLTYAANGTGLTNHAWTIARIDGVWYHLDVQLEQNVSRRDRVLYRYFMKSDAHMSGSHRWGQNLIHTGLLTAEQNEELARDFQHPACPQDYPTPAPHNYNQTPMPDLAAIRANINTEIREYESIHGPLEPLELNIIPPVFGTQGFGGTP